MVSKNQEAVLVFDLHFKLVTKPEGVIAFLNQFKNDEINQSEFYGKVKFQTIVDILEQNKHLKGKEDAFQQELDGMFNEIKLEICRRLRMLLIFERLSNTLNEDWKKIRVFNSILIDLKQQGLFDMIKELMKENRINLGNRLAFEEKYKPFVPNLNGKNSRNHFKAILKSTFAEEESNLVVWLSQLEFEKVFKKEQKDNYVLATSLPEELIYEKIIPKLIDQYTLIFNIGPKKDYKIQEIFQLGNYYLSREID